MHYGNVDPCHPSNELWIQSSLLMTIAMSIVILSPYAHVRWILAHRFITPCIYPQSPTAETVQLLRTHYSGRFRAMIPALATRKTDAGILTAQRNLLLAFGSSRADGTVWVVATGS